MIIFEIGKKKLTFRNLHQASLSEEFCSYFLKEYGQKKLDDLKKNIDLQKAIRNYFYNSSEIGKIKLIKK